MIHPKAKGHPRVIRIDFGFQIITEQVRILIVLHP